MTECPQCGGEIWDNRAKKRAGDMKAAAPDYACKDKENCAWVQWPPKLKTVTKTASGPGMPAEQTARPPRWTWPTLAETYLQSLLIARKQVSGLSAALKLDLRMEDILSAAATIFIAASRDGVRTPVRVESEEPEEIEAR